MKFVDEISDELKIDNDIVKLVIGDFWKGIHYYLNHPDESKLGIYFPEFLNFKIQPYRAKRYENQHMIKEYKYEGSKQKRSEFYERLNNSLKQHERKGSKQILDERLDA